jgi:hypothetical protein
MERISHIYMPTWIQHQKKQHTRAMPIWNNGELPEGFTLQQVNIPPVSNRLLKDQKVDGRRPQVVNGKQHTPTISS